MDWSVMKSRIEGNLWEKPPAHKYYSPADIRSELFISADHEIGRFHHKVCIINKPPVEGKRNRNSNWFCKAVSDAYFERNKWYAEKATIAAELLRFFMPWHPRTRTWITAENAVYVLSEAIPKFSDFCDEKKKLDQPIFYEKIFAGRRDLAKILVLSIFLDEFDLREQNIGFGEDLRCHRSSPDNEAPIRITRIDTEVCFSELHQRFDRSIRHGISVDDLKNLFSPSHFQPRIWLNFDYFFYINLLQDPDFQLAVNQTILEILQLPNQFFEVFVDSYTDVPRSVVILTELLVKRREMLRVAASQFDLFQSYLLTATVKADITAFHQRSKQFTTMHKMPLWPRVFGIENAMKKQAMDLRNLVLAITLRQHIIENNVVQAILFIRQYPDFSFTILMKTEGLSFLHLAVIFAPNLKLIRFLCEQCGADAFQEDSYGRTALSLAIRDNRSDLVRYFLENANYECEWNEIRDGINCIINGNDSIHSKLEWVDYIRRCPLVGSQEKYIFSEQLLSCLINRAVNKYQVIYLFRQLNVMEDANPFLRNGLRLWNNNAEEIFPWTEMIVLAKQKIVALAKESNDFSRDEEVVDFLKIPTTRGYFNFFSRAPSELEEYFRLGDIHGVYQLYNDNVRCVIL